MSRPASSACPKFEYRLNSRFNFGKHRGRTVEDVIAIDPDWLNWAVENIPNFKLSNEAFKKLEAQPPKTYYYEQDDDLDNPYWGWGRD